MKLAFAFACLLMILAGLFDLAPFQARERSGGDRVPRTAARRRGRRA